MTLRNLCLLFISLFLLAACGGGGGGSTTTPSAAVEIAFASSGVFIPNPTHTGRLVWDFILFISFATSCLTGTLVPVTPATDT